MTDEVLNDTKTGSGFTTGPRNAPRRPPQRVIPVDPETTHGKGWRRPPDLGFLNEIGVCPITVQECTRLAAHVPILFRKTRDRVEPMAVFRLFKSQSHSFLGPDNRLIRSARPLASVVYPFVAMPGPNADSLRLGFDAESGLMIPEWENDAQAFFTPTGGLDPLVEKIAKSMVQTQQLLALARIAAKALDSAGCLIPVRAEDQPMRTAAFWSIHRPTLDALPAEKLADLHHKGALALAYSQLTSLEALRVVMTGGIGKAGQPATPATSQSSGEDAEMEGFLAVLAQDLVEDGFDDL
ncbi:SapC family protein [Pseudooceanicola sp. MF1-13]|uniref:SapC family protein n=1 Tax=Pseudooceanicola sp. MF1-13 TaxID=3379095 RepID=UPI0038926AEA